MWLPNVDIYMADGTPNVFAFEIDNLDAAVFE